MGDTRPLASSEHFLLSDVEGSRADLNRDPDDNLREGKPSIFSLYNVNGRMIIIIISLLCFILAFALFIGTIIVFYSRPVVPDCTLDSFSASVQANKAKSASEGELDFNDNYNKKHDQPEESSTTPYTPLDFFPTETQAGPKPSAEEWSVTVVNGKHVRPGELVYNEEFETFNTTNWEHRVGDSANTFFYYVNERTNSYSQNGKLFLKPTFTADKYGHDYIYNGTMFLGTYPSEKCSKGNMSALCWKNQPEEIVHPIMSALITSKTSLSFQYGRLVIRAKMPGGDWIEPIISLQPSKSMYGEGLNNGQVHLIDTRGNKILKANGQNVGSEQTCPDIRFGTDLERKTIFYCLNTEENKGYDTDFHDYEVLWTPESITIKIDGEGIVSAPDPRPSMYKLWSRGIHHQNPWARGSNKKMAPFDTPFHVVMGVNVGGVAGFFHDDFESPYPKPWKNSDTNAAKTFWENRMNWESSWEGDAPAMQIESVKLWSLNVTTISD